MLYVRSLSPSAPRSHPPPPPPFSPPLVPRSAKACWLAGIYADIQFHDGQGHGPTFAALLQHVVAAIAGQWWRVVACGAQRMGRLAVWLPGWECWLAGRLAGVGGGGLVGFLAGWVGD